MAIHQVAVGKDLYVFTNKAGMNLDAWGANPNCIIDSHGLRPLSKPYFTVRPGQTIHFYVNRHTFLVVDENQKGPQDNRYHVVDSVEKISNGWVQPVETIVAGQRCPDYELAKQVKSEFGHQHDDRYDNVGYHDLRRYLERNPEVASRFDLVSIRNRALRTVMLSDLLRKLAANGYGYATVHCSFCRGTVIDGVKDIFGHGRDEMVGGVRYRR
jgi:hypothetical protein